MKKITVLMAAALLTGSFMISCQSQQSTQPQKESTSQEQTETITTQEKAQETTIKTDETTQEKTEVKKETVAQNVQTLKPSKKIDGEQLFKQKTCSSCHQPKIDMTGPSLQKIAKAYAGKREELKAFLRGKHPAIVEPNKFTIMKPQINITKRLTEEELNTLIDYIYKWQ